MRWEDQGRSSDLDDERGGGGGFGGFGGGGGFPLLGLFALRGMGLGGFLLLLLLSFLFRTNILGLLGGGNAARPSEGRSINDPAEEKEVHFVSFVLDDAQKTWTSVLGERGVRYPHARLVLFRNRVQSGCGVAGSQTGPFYCPADERVYIDLAFYDELQQRFGAPGQFAQAYVLAHEIGHHVQDVLGTERKVRALMEDNPGQRNELSVKLELQADCYAGVWGHATEQRNLLEAGEAEQALKAAAAVGDDRLQRMSGRAVSPESFTHGSSEQRMHWFQQGFTTGNIDACNTFAQ